VTILLQLLVTLTSFLCSATRTYPTRVAQNPRLRQLLHERSTISIRTERVIDRIRDSLKCAHLSWLLRLPSSRKRNRRAPDVRLPCSIERRIASQPRRVDSVDKYGQAFSISSDDRVQLGNLIKQSRAIEAQDVGPHIDMPNPRGRPKPSHDRSRVVTREQFGHNIRSRGSRLQE
jgi:hypothetical protein